MPKIREYASKFDKLTLDEKGYQAWEMAGRRIGPLYNQAGTEYGKMAKNVEEAAKLAETDISEYDKQIEMHRNARGGGGGGGGGGGSKPPSVTGPRAAERLTRAAAAVTSKPGKMTGPTEEDVGALTPAEQAASNKQFNAWHGALDKYNAANETAADDALRQQDNRRDAAESNFVQNKSDPSTGKFSPLPPAVTPDVPYGLPPPDSNASAGWWSNSDATPQAAYGSSPDASALPTGPVSADTSSPAPAPADVSLTAAAPGM